MGVGAGGRSSGVGGFVQSICGKCGPMEHVVIALVDGRIARVECRDCGARHRYRPTGGRAAAAAGPRRPRARGAATRGRRTGPPVVEADPSRPVRPFDASDSYQVGDRIAHAHFGEGVVQAVMGPTKVQVLFGSGAKTLVQGRSR